MKSLGVTEETWRDFCREEPGSGISESPTYVARGVSALAADTDHGWSEDNPEVIEKYR